MPAGPQGLSLTSVRMLRSEFVRKLAGIDQVVARLGDDPAKVVEYTEETGGNVYEAIENGYTTPFLLVYIDSITPEGFPALIRVGMSIAVRCDDPFGMFEDICNGISAASGSDGLTFLSSTILHPYGPMAIPTFERQFIQLGNSQYDFWALKTGFRDRNSR